MRGAKSPAGPLLLLFYYIRAREATESGRLADACARCHLHNATGGLSMRPVGTELAHAGASEGWSRGAAAQQCNMMSEVDR